MWGTSGEAARNKGGSPSEEKVSPFSALSPNLSSFFTFSLSARGSDERSTTQSLSNLALLEKKGKQNIGLDFPISIENWLNLSTTAHDTHYCCYNLLKITTKLSQRRATKFILENWWWLWKKRNLLSLQDRRFLFDALFFYNGFINIDISPFFTFNRILIGTPWGVGIIVYLRRIMLRQTFSNLAFFNRIVDMWNALPLSTRCAVEGIGRFLGYSIISRIFL